MEDIKNKYLLPNIVYRGIINNLAKAIYILTPLMIVSLYIRYIDFGIDLLMIVEIVISAIFIMNSLYFKFLKVNICDDIRILNKQTMNSLITTFVLIYIMSLNLYSYCGGEEYEALKIFIFIQIITSLIGFIMIKTIYYKGIEKNKVKLWTLIGINVIFIVMSFRNIESFNVKITLIYKLAVIAYSIGQFCIVKLLYDNYIIKLLLKSKEV